MSETNVTPPSGKQPRRWLGPAFLASLTLNIFLVGLISVPLFFRAGPDMDFGPPPGGAGPGMFHQSLRDLPEEDRRAIRKVMLGHFPQIRPHLVEMRKAKMELAAAVAADPYDEDAVRDAFDKMELAMKEMGEIGRDAMMTGFAKLTPEQRQRVGEAMRKEEENGRMRWRDRRDNREGRDGPPDVPGDMEPPAP
ncbi:periplasmic heavy metal sensor [Parvibaculum sp.]|uniref:periplasmic heavy metal sensor n=2 Tax=Parvibaculum sp. TaxID=2024848 RepID=UPI0032973482